MGGVICSVLGGYLCVSKIIALIVMECETESALILPQVISHEVRVLGQVYGFQGQAPQALPSVNSLDAHKHQLPYLNTDSCLLPVNDRDTQP